MAFTYLEKDAWQSSEKEEEKKRKRKREEV